VIQCSIERIEAIKLARMRGDELAAAKAERDLCVEMLEEVSGSWQDFQAEEAKRVRRILRTLEMVRP
jgi:hypothetical protein